MNENEKSTAAEMDALFGGEELNLGSAAADTGFDPFASPDNGSVYTADAATHEEESGGASNEESTVENADEGENAEEAEDDPNPLAAALNDAEAKTAEKTQQGLFGKAPVFDYAGAQEDIEDLSQTFEDLRIAKAADFPEFADGKRVSWKVEYGKITKTVSIPKDTTIGKMKMDIEQSKEFLDALKKTKDADALRCKLKPQVTAQSKGKLPAYKGIFPNIEAAAESGKLISIVPANDGRVYEIRNTEMGQFIAPLESSRDLSEIRAGFTPALPRVPAGLLVRIISFFRCFMDDCGNKEALVNLYWDKEQSEYIVDVPEQVVSYASVHSQTNEKYAGNRYIHFMDVHSHNSMNAFFSSVDNADEKATRLYMVIGCLDKYFPDIKLRASNGGRFIDLHPADIFQQHGDMFPTSWIENVQFRDGHADEQPIDLPKFYKGKRSRLYFEGEDFI